MYSSVYRRYNKDDLSPCAYVRSTKRKPKKPQDAENFGIWRPFMNSSCETAITHAALANQNSEETKVSFSSTDYIVMSCYPHTTCYPRTQTKQRVKI